MQTREFTINSVTDPELAAALAEAKQREEEANLRLAKLAAERAELEAATQRAEAKRKEEEENLQAAKLAAERAEAEAAAQKAEAEAARLRREAEEEERLRLEAEAEAERRHAAEEAERLRLEAEAEEQRRVEAEARRIAAQNVADAERAAELAEAEARKIAAQNVADAERAAELAEAKRKEEEENLQAAKLAAERAEAERLLLEAEEQKRMEAEARQIAAQKVADAERAAELAEAKRKEEEENLQAAKLAAERAEIEATTQKAEAEAEAAKALRAEELLKQEKVQIESERVHKASEKAAEKEKKKAEDKAKKKVAKKRKKKYRSYRDFSAVKLILWVVGVLALVVLLYLFATPISKGFHIGKNAADTFLAEKLPKVAETLKIKGNGYDMPIFKEDSVYLKEDAENYVQTAIWPQGYSASVVRRNGMQYICVEGDGLKMFYLNEISGAESKHVYLEKGEAKAMYFKEYSFENPASLCPARGVYNAAGVEQYIFPATELGEMQILEADTLKECRIVLQAEDMTDVLNFVECHEDGQNIQISMTSEEIPYTFWVMKRGGLSLKDGYKFVLDGIRYETGVKKISFKAYVTSAGQYLGEVTGRMDYVAGGYAPAEVTFYAFADDEYVSGQASAITATHYKGAESKRKEVIGENGERLLVPVN